MFFLTPRYIKEAKHYLHGARKFLAYKKDILTDPHREDLEGLINELKGAIRSRDRHTIDRVVQSINTLAERAVPPLKHSWIRENVEVILVAIVIAAGVKAYLLQPFRIPTGSMQPTLYGIVGVPTDTPPPNLLVRAFDLVVRGRHHFDLRAAATDVVVSLQERTYLNFFTLPTAFMRFLPSFCFSRSFRLRVISPP